jgi:gluconokinase
MHSLPYCIGIDIGTGSTKAIAIDVQGNKLQQAQGYYATQSSDEYNTQYPNDIWSAFQTCIREIVDTIKAPPSFIALSSAMHSLLLVDEHGVPITDVLTWADNRSAHIAAQLHTSTKGESIYNATGTPIHAMSPLCKIRWFKEHEPEIFQHAHKFISIKEYIWWKLFQTYEVDYSIASATGLFNINTLTWHDESLEIAGIRKEQLSIPVDTNFQRHTVLPTLGIHDAVKIMIGASDGCMANVGSFAKEPGIAALTIGTSGAIRVASKRPVLNFKGMTFNYYLDAKTFICGGPINNGGVVLQWYAQHFLQRALTPETYSIIFKQLDQTSPGAEGLCFLPYLYGERAPLWSSNTCGTFHGIKAHHRQEHFTRAVIEGITLALYHIGVHLHEASLSFDQIHVSGGFVHAPAWLQLLADIFGKPVNLYKTEDASALGAAYMGLTTNGFISNDQQLKPREATQFIPRSEHTNTYQNVVFPNYRKLTYWLFEIP